MGNAHSGFNLTRTSGALDSFVAELGGDIIYDKRCVTRQSVPVKRTEVGATALGLPAS